MNNLKKARIAIEREAVIELKRNGDSERYRDLIMMVGCLCSLIGD